MSIPIGVDESGEVVYTKVTFNTALSDDEDGNERHGTMQIMLEDHTTQV